VEIFYGQLLYASEITTIPSTNMCRKSRK